MFCSSCGASLPEGARFCSACSAAVGESSASDLDAPTELAPSSGASRSRPASIPAASTSDEARFLPGTTLAERYRIVGLLGRGGMGEVYRADDLKLGQPVALKFLPERAAHEPDWLDRFLNEVKIARQVSHPNVCRVYDVGEVEGQHFLSMEYIDGEDLASLLRRIGRLPEDKAVQIARQICAGLAAAHGVGVLHRDLKPANVMIDGRGHAHLTDFGLAGLAEAMTQADAFSGTPAFMAPEQLAGREVTEKSDIYSLGLVLYQLFTGKPAFEAQNVQELTRLQQESSPTNPTLHVEALDRAVGSAILRCLEVDPEARPASALAVSAALPGGDPLAAALAAGETPSPEMVAAAGETGSLSPKLAGGLFAAFALLTAGFVALNGSFQTTSVIPMDKPRDVLIDRAGELLAELGSPPEEVGDSAFGFSFDPDASRYIESNDSSGDPLEQLRSGRPSVLNFWYRVDRNAMQPRNLLTRVFWTDPPKVRSGAAAVRLDTRGLLLEYQRVPDQVAGEAGEVSEVDWSAVFEAAGLDLAAFEAAPPTWTPPVFGDRRRAWVGETAELPGVEVRVEAAELAGEPVYFRLVGPWSRPERQTRFASSTQSKINQLMGLTLLGAILIFAVWMGHRHARAGRGDPKGATRVASCVFGVNLVSWLLSSHHVANPSRELAMFFTGAGNHLLQAALTWLLYMALEPFVRRSYPEWIIGWSRLLAGRYRDPLVARNVLVGAVGGAGVTFLVIAAVPLERLAGASVAIPQDPWTQSLHGLRWALASFFDLVANGIFSGMFVVAIWFLLCRVLRLRWLAGLVLVVILALGFSAGGGFSYVDVIVATLAAGVFVLILVRFGLLAMISLVFFTAGLSNLALTFEVSAWYVRNSWIALAALVAVAAYAFHVSLGGRKLFSDELAAD